MSFQPICGLCLSDCDRRGSVTSCSHFLCSRCLSRLPTAAPCPLCHRPCRMMVLDQPEVQPLLQSGATALDQVGRVVGTQLRHYQQVNRRMRQALEMLHGQYQALRREREEEAAAHAGEAQKTRALETECRRLRERLRTRASSAVAPSPQPPPLGWSASSNIARRRHVDSGDATALSSPSVSSTRGGGDRRADDAPFLQTSQTSRHAASSAGAASPVASAVAALNSGDFLTPRSQAIASLQQRTSASRPGEDRLPEGSTVPPSHNFRLDTPLAAALQQRHAVASPSPALYTSNGAVRPTSRPLQKLFALRGAAP